MEGASGPPQPTIPVFVVLLILAWASIGCGSGSRVVETEDPERTFAPVVELSPGERWRPMGAHWFLERSVLMFATDGGCRDFTVAVGRTLKELHSGPTDWIFSNWLGKARPGYERYPTDARCDVDFSYEFYSVQHTRPFGRTDRPRGLPRAEGWYLDLVDRARPGPRQVRHDGARRVLEGIPAYVERTPELVDGQRGLRLTYWFLYGMNEPRQSATADGTQTHEGDWERVDVLLEEGDAADNYEPVGVRLRTSDGGSRQLPWDDLPRVGDRGSGTPTHAVLAAARGSHELSPRTPDRRCSGCTRWLTWERLRDLRREPWYGFGGAWGEVGDDSATTGPLGPHGKWPEGRELANSY
jgi:hypothetical protein